MKLQVCWQQMGCVQLAMSGKEQRVMYLLSRFLLVCFGPLLWAPVTFSGCYTKRWLSRAPECNLCRQKWLLHLIHCITTPKLHWPKNAGVLEVPRTQQTTYLYLVFSDRHEGGSHFNATDVMQSFYHTPHIHLILFHHTALPLCRLIRCFWLCSFCFSTDLLVHTPMCPHRHFLQFSLFLFVCAFRLAGATLVNRGCCFQRDWYLPLWQTGIFSNVDSEVGVERLQLFGQELIGQRVEAIRAPVKSGPFQKVKPGKTNSGSNVKGILST